MSNPWLAIKQLDRQLKEWQAVSQKYGTPRIGWVKTLREALSMTAEQLANRLGLSRARIVQLENSEVNDAVTLRALKEAASAMECEFVYAIVPKGNATLEDIIKTRAAQVAHERIATVAHTMALEEQSVDSHLLKTQKNELTRTLTEHLNKKLWSEHYCGEVKANDESKLKLAESIASYILNKNETQNPIQRNALLSKMNTAQFTKLLHVFLSSKKNIKQETELLKNLNNTRYISELRKSTVHIINKHEKKINRQNDIFQKLIENLQKKK